MKKLFLLIVFCFAFIPVFSEDYERVETTMGIVFAENTVLPEYVPVDINTDFLEEDIVYKKYSSSLSSIGFIYSSDYFVKDSDGYSVFAAVLFHYHASESLDNNKIYISDFDLRFGSALGANWMKSKAISDSLRFVFKPGVQLFFTCYDTKDRNSSEMFLGLGPYINLCLKSYSDSYIYNFGLTTSYNIGYLSTNAAELTQYDPINTKNIAFMPYISIGFNR